jgi:hypothetical protein
MMHDVQYEPFAIPSGVSRSDEAMSLYRAAKQPPAYRQSRSSATDSSGFIPANSFSDRSFANFRHPATAPYHSDASYNSDSSDRTQLQQPARQPAQYHWPGHSQLPPEPILGRYRESAPQTSRGQPTGWMTDTQQWQPRHDHDDLRMRQSIDDRYVQSSEREISPHGRQFASERHHAERYRPREFDKSPSSRRGRPRWGAD